LEVLGSYQNRGATGTKLRGHWSHFGAPEAPRSAPVPVVIITVRAAASIVPVRRQPSIGNFAFVLGVVGVGAIANGVESLRVGEHRAAARTDVDGYVYGFPTLEIPAVAPLPIVIITFWATLTVVPVRRQERVTRGCWCS